MIPIWAKTLEGKWEPFPCDILETFEDGRQGFSNYAKSDHQFTMLERWVGKGGEFAKWHHLFTYETHKHRYVLTDRK